MMNLLINFYLLFLNQVNQSNQLHLLLFLGSFSGNPSINLTETEVNTILLTCPHVMAPWN